MGEDTQSLLNFSAAPFLKAMESCQHAVAGFYKSLGQATGNPFEHLAESGRAAAAKLKSYWESFQAAGKSAIQAILSQTSPFEHLAAAGQAALEKVKGMGDAVAQGVGKMGEGIKHPIELLKHCWEMTDGLRGALSTLGFPLDAFSGVQKVAENLKQVVENGKQLHTLSSVTGESVSSLVALQDAFDESGAGSGNLQSSLTSLRSALSGTNADGQSTSGVFASLGLNLQQLRGRSALQQFQQIGVALNKLPTQAARTSAAMAIFGQQGAQMMALFANPAQLNESAESMKNYGAVMDRNAGLFAKISNGLDHLSQQGQHLFAGMLDQLAPAIGPLIDRLEKIDLTHLGQQIGKTAREFWKAFDTGHRKLFKSSRNCLAAQVRLACREAPHHSDL